MIIPVSEKEKERLADAVFFMYDLLWRIEDIDKDGKLNGVRTVIDDAIAHLKAIEEDMDW